MHHLAAKRTHFLGGKNTTAPLTVRCGFLFCFQAKEEMKLSKMDGGKAAEADGTSCLEVERCQRGRLGGLPRDARVAVPSGEGGRMRQGTAPSRAPAPFPGWIRSVIPAEPQPH